MTNPVFLNVECHVFSPYSNLFFSGASFILYKILREMQVHTVQDVKFSFLFRDTSLTPPLIYLHNILVHLSVNTE